MIRWIQPGLATLMAVVSLPVFAATVIVEAPNGKELELFLPRGQERKTLTDAVREHFGTPVHMQRYRFDANEDGDDDDRPPSKTLRDWERGWSKAEYKDIKYIVSALAYKGKTWLLKNKGELEKRGKRIKSVHPLRFMEILFSDGDLKYAMHELSGYGWDGLLSGLKSSLDEETARNNMIPKFRQAFAQAIAVDLADFDHYFTGEEAGDWEDLVRTLISLVPLDDDDDWDL